MDFKLVLLLGLVGVVRMDDCIPAATTFCPTLCDENLSERFIEHVILTGPEANFDCVPSHVKVSHGEEYWLIIIS